MTIDFENYIKFAGSALLDALQVFDLAVSAEKMTRWDCLGSDNQAWSSGPYLTCYKGEADIDRTRPYICAVSEAFSKAATLVVNEELIDRAGRAKIPTLKTNFQEWHAESIVAKLAIIEQFEHYKSFAQGIGGPFNAGSSEIWANRIPERASVELKALIDRRNELTHQHQVRQATARESVEFFISLRWIASLVWNQHLADLAGATS